MAEQTLTATMDTAVVNNTPAVETPVTGEAFAAMNVGRAELIEGRVVEMSPPQSLHARCEFNFSLIVGGFVRERRLGKVLVGEAGIYTRRNPDTVRGMDVAYISNERWARQKDKDGFLEIAPDLIVEVLSPHDYWKDVIQKLREYFNLGVRLVWVADPDTRTVFAYRSLTEIREFKTDDILTADDVLPGFSASLSSLFED